jgi:cell division protease FtsH
MEGYWGMGSTVTSHGVTHEVGIGGGGKPGIGDKDKDLLASTLGVRIEEKLNSLLERTEDLLDANRHAVLAVAHALETNKTVTGEDIEAVIEGRQGPIIDGRPYADAEFMARVESYNTEAVLAHKGHATVNLPLPGFVPTAPTPAAGNGEVTGIPVPVDAEGDKPPA